MGLQVGGGRGWTGVKMQDGGPLNGSGCSTTPTVETWPGPASARLLIPGDWPCPLQGLSEMEGFREEPGPSGPLSGFRGCAGLGAVSLDPASPALSSQGPRGLRGLPGPLGPPGDRVSLPAPTHPQFGGAVTCPGSVQMARGHLWTSEGPCEHWSSQQPSMGRVTWQSCLWASLPSYIP